MPNDYPGIRRQSPPSADTTDTDSRAFVVPPAAAGPVKLGDYVIRRGSRVPVVRPLSPRTVAVGEAIRTAATIVRTVAPSAIPRVLPLWRALTLAKHVLRFSTPRRDAQPPGFRLISGWTHMWTVSWLAEPSASPPYLHSMPDQPISGQTGLVPANYTPLTVPSAYNGFGVWEEDLYEYGVRARSLSKFVRNPQPAEFITTPGLPAVVARPALVEVPTPLPYWLDPALQPIGKPSLPAPVPWDVIPSRRVDPTRDPVERTDFGSRVGPLQPSPSPYPRTGIGWVEMPPPFEINIDSDRATAPTPGNRLKPQPQPKPRPGTAPGEAPPWKHKVGPPARTRNRKRKDKEKKLIANAKKGGLTDMFVNGVTESLDYLDAFYDALPDVYKQIKNRRPIYKDGKLVGYYYKDPTPQEKIRQVIISFDKIDFNEALKNVAKNALEDYLIGKVGQANAKASGRIGRLTGRPVGITTGPAL